MHLDDALGYGEPQASAALLARNRIVGLLELLKQFGLVRVGYAATGVLDGQVERPIVCFDQYLRQAAPVTAA